MTVWGCVLSFCDTRGAGCHKGRSVKVVAVDAPEKRSRFGAVLSESVVVAEGIAMKEGEVGPGVA